MKTMELTRRAETARAAADALPTTPGAPGMIVSCLDARVDPAHIFGVEPGECSVIRNIGGRLTDATIDQIGIIAGMAKAMAGDDAELDLAVVHHTDCGASRFGMQPLQQMAAATAGTEPAEVAALAIDDPEVSVKADIAKLAASALPRGLNVSGYVYDVETGELTEVVSTGRLAER